VFLVWQPALHSAPNGTAPDREWQAADARMTGRMRQLTVVGSVALALATLLSIPLQAAQIAQVAPWAVFGEPLARFVASRPGILLVVRLLLALAALVVARTIRPVSAGRSRWLALLALLAATPLTWSLGSHAAALGSGAVLAIALDWLHILAAIVWLGGLVPLVFALSAALRQPQQALPPSALVPRFTRIALASVVTLALTGLYSYTQHVGRLELLPATTYGRALLAKTGLFAVLLLLGGLNLFILSPRMRQGAAQLAGQFRRVVRIELVLGALVLLLAGAMTSVAPSQTAWEAHLAQGLVEQAQVGDVGLTLRVAPAVIGSNQFAVDLHDPRPGAASVPAEVLLRFGMQGMQAEPVETPMQTSDTQRYTASGAFMTMGGRWDVEVVVRRAGFDDVRHTFKVDVLRNTASAGGE
jgi:copper transport protein